MSNIDFQFDSYSELLSSRIQDAITSNNPIEIEKIRKLFNNESWDSIVNKFNSEGSIWIVWWVDAVNVFIRYEMQDDF